MNELIIMTNSPGELAGWVVPTVRAAVEAGLDAEITVVALPCQYASGMELREAEDLEGVSRAVTLKEAMKYARYRRGRALLLQLGGDPMFGAAFSVKTGADWAIYTSRPKWQARVSRYFIPDAKAKKRFESAKVDKKRYEVVGNLMLDSIPYGICAEEARRELSVGSGPAVAFLPGSRPFEYELGAPFFIRAAEELSARFPGMTALMPLAPTVDYKLFEQGLSAFGLSVSEGGRIAGLSEGSDVRVVKNDTFKAIKASHLAVALPGTNNLQIAALDVPLLVVAPLNRAEDIPLDGLAGLIPLGSAAGRALKKRLVFWYNARERFVSLANRAIDSEVVPEYRCIMTPSTVANLAEELLAAPEKLEEIKSAYGKLPLERGASGRVAASVKSYFEKGRFPEN
jgi:hypothetical protein